MENSGSESVVLPDISEAEHIASEHDANENGAGDNQPRVSVSTVRHAGVPVTLPVGSLIASTFNVITQDQLPHYKPMICVDNGFISADGTEQELKATHIVIQDSLDDRVTVNNSSNVQNSAGSWQEAANSPVLSVRCKNTSAELHKNRFGSGGRGRCIKLGKSTHSANKCGFNWEYLFYAC